MPVDMGGLYAVPGLVDLHFHGCMGRDFCDGTHEAISTLAKYQAQIGVAAICPATMTYPGGQADTDCRSRRNLSGGE